MQCVECCRTMTGPSAFMMMCGHQVHRYCIRSLFYDGRFSCPSCSRVITGPTVWLFVLQDAVLPEPATTSMTATESTSTTRANAVVFADE